jgi:AcrR family transcriptional regulator
MAKRRKLDREETEKRLIAAFETVWTRDGVQGLGVNAVLKEACVGKSLLYRYFGSFAGLAQAWSQRETFLPHLSGASSALKGGEANAVERHVRGAIAYAAALRSRPRTRELLVVELLRRSPLTNALDAMRARFGREMRQFVFATGASDSEDAFALSFFVTAALSYLAMRSASVPDYYGLKLDRDADWQRIENMLRLIATRVLDQPQR